MQERDQLDYRLTGDIQSTKPLQPEGKGYDASVPEGMEGQNKKFSFLP